MTERTNAVIGRTKETEWTNDVSQRTNVVTKRTNVVVGKMRQ